MLSGWVHLNTPRPAGPAINLWGSCAVRPPAAGNEREDAMTRNGRYSNGHRRRKARLAVLASEDVCGICRQPVDKTLRLGADGKPHPLSPEVDEIVPFSLGGSPYSRANLQLTHRICNQKKGNRVAARAELPPVRPPLRVSRNW